MNILSRLDDGELQKKASFVRKDVVDICVRNGAGHIAPSLSCVDILTALYYSVMNVSSDPRWEGRDRLVFSKSHGGYGLYSILCDLGYIRREDWESFYKGSFLSGCAERSPEHGLEAGCGSLGHGLPIATGIAFGAALQGKKYRTYCIVGDGELQEGSNWEAIQFAVKYNLSNLVLIVDNNYLQAMDFIENILTVKGRKDDIETKLSAFGFRVASCDGHNVSGIRRALASLAGSGPEGAPQALVAKTVKGYGLECMENVPKFHFRLPTEEELQRGKRYE